MGRVRPSCNPWSRCQQFLTESKANNSAIYA